MTVLPSGWPMVNNQRLGSISNALNGVVVIALASWMVVCLPQRAFAQEKGIIPTPQQQEPPALSAAHELSLQERADIFMARKEYADAADYYLRALKTQKDGQASLWNKLGIAYQQQEKFEPARKAYKMALHYQKDFPEAWNNMGTTYFLQDKAKKSVKYYHRAVALNPDAASFHLNLGTAYCRIKKYQPAVSEYVAALTLDPNILREHSAQGTVVDARGEGEKLYFYLAKALASKGRADEAIRYLRRAFEVGFNDRELLGKDPDFQKISSDPAFVELLNHPPVAIKD